MTLPDGRLPDSVKSLIPARFVEHHQVVPVAVEGDTLHVVHRQDLDPSVLRELAVFLDLKVEGRGVPQRELTKLIRENYGLGAQAIESLVGTDAPQRASVRSSDTGPTGSAASPEEDGHIVRFVTGLLEEALRERATDIHIEPFEKHLRVRFRIDGFLHDVPVPSDVDRFHASIVSRVKVLAHLDIAEHRLPQDGKFHVQLEGKAADLRVSILPTPYGESVNIRVLADAADLVRPESLGWEASDLAVVRDVLAKPHGVVLVTGPTGSGKTTTLYSFLSSQNEIHRKILTIEDPIEYDLHGVTQVQIHPRIGLTFAKGLRAMLRHDPDVMMVGEIRDEETAETVIRVALTGHLVFSTVHTNDAPSTPVRLMDMGIEPYLVASSLECLIAQRLVRKLCPDCARPLSGAPTPDSLGVPDEVFEALTADREPAFREGGGCARCRNTGYRGRTAIFEVLPVTAAIRDLILARASSGRVADEARRAGFWPLRWKGLLRAACGETSIQEVLRVTAAHGGGS